MRLALRLASVACQLATVVCPLHSAETPGGSARVELLNNQEISPLQDARNYGMAFPGVLVRCVLDCGCPLSLAEGGAFRLGTAAQGGAQGGERPRPRIFLRSCWAGEGLWAYQEGQIGQKMVRFGSLRPTRSRQDESMEVGEVGSKRPSSGGKWGACRFAVCTP
jgi:hypothetical protein